WKGTLPEGVRRIDSPTNTVWALVRFLVDGEADRKNVLALQDQLTLTPLSAWDKPGRASDPGKGSEPPAYDRSQPLQLFAHWNRGLNETPPPAREAALMSLFGQIGIGPDKTFRPDTLDPATARGLERAVRVGQQLIAAPFGTGSRVNGWWIPAKEIGNFGD